MLSFAFDKIKEATNSIYFPGSRFYLAYPIIFIFIIAWGFEELGDRQKQMFLSVSIALACLAFSVKILAFDTFLGIDLGPTKNTIVHAMKVNDLYLKCSQIQKFSNEKPDLIIAGADISEDKILNYGCPCMIEDFPPDILVHYERRTWLLPQMENQIYQKILIYGLDSTAWEKMDHHFPDIIKGDKKQGLLFINNKKKTGDLLKEIAF